nr:unnamed protein product [Callosobruchus analis]
MWDRLVIYILTSKFDKTTRRDWEAYKYKNELPNMEDMNMFLKERCEMLEKLETNKQDNSLKNKEVSSSLVTNAVSKLKCYVCEKDHTFYNCDVLLNMPVEKRVEKVKSLKLCIICFKPNHPFWKCRARRCIKCNKTHNSLLHIDDGTENERPSVNSTRTVCEIGSVPEAAHVLLPTALVKIIVGGQTYTARALLDSGSQSSFATEALCNRLQLEKLHIDHTVRGIGMGTINIKNRVNIKISSVYNKFKLDVGCLVISKITDKLPRCTFKKSIIKIPEHLKLADPNFNVTGEVDILLGAQEFWKIVCVGQMSLGASMPFLQNTRLGWIIAGTFGIANQEESFSYLTVDAEESTNELVSKFWTLEEVKNDRVTSLGDQYCEKYFAVRSLKQLSQETVEISPIVSKVIDEDFYMDDLLTGANSESSLLEIQRGVTNVLAKSCLDLRKWMCSDPELIRRFEINENLEASILNLGEGENNKTLGICWNAVKDTMQYSVRSKVDHCDVFSKRSILSSVFQIFDPLGLIGPVVITGKLIIQELWKLKISWDDAVPPEIKQRWITFERDLECLNNLRIPRRSLITNNTLIELHGFCDATERAYGACIYIRSFSASVGYSSNIFCAKTRVAPLKLVSLPRLELCGAVLLANLAKRVCSALNINFDRKYYYTDSMVALAWIKGEPTRWKTFVANRVSEIQGLTSSCEWYHIASEDNPADVLSRSLPPSQLENHNLWWHGPKWLTQENSSWKVSSNIKIDLAVPEQRKLASTTLLAGNNQKVVLNLIDKFSSFLRLQRVLAYVLRFLNSCKMQNKRRVGVLSREELDDSLRLLIKTVQLECFEVEYNCLLKGKQIPTKSNILALNPFMHQDVLRVGVD